MKKDEEVGIGICMGINLCMRYFDDLHVSLQFGP